MEDKDKVEKSYDFLFTKPIGAAESYSQRIVGFFRDLDRITWLVKGVFYLITAGAALAAAYNTLKGFIP